MYIIYVYTGSTIISQHLSSAVSKIAVNVSVVYLAMGEDLKPKSIVTFNVRSLCELETYKLFMHTKL